ncbi:MAG: biotin synthase BioB [Pseudomonadota bacterium]
MTDELTDVHALLTLPLLDLLQAADGIRREHTGGAVELCTILNAKSGRCSENCRFCAQSSRHATGIPAYPLKTRQEIVAAAHNAKEIGARRFGIVCSGNKPTDREFDVITEAAAEITRSVGISICASLGALPEAMLTQLHQAGVTRYHHNIETSRRFYPQVVDSHNFDERLSTIRAAHAAGLEVCSGGIIGMGETWEDRIDMALLLKELPVASVPVNILVPIKGTPFERLTPLSCNDVVRTLCIFRIILKNRTIKIAAGRESAFNDFQALGFMAGANGMLIGGYLTVKGRDIAADQKLVREIETMWEREHDRVAALQ